MRPATLAVVVLAAAACGGPSNESICPRMLPPPSGSAAPGSVSAPPTSPPTVDEARAFVAEVEANLRRLWVARDQANWVNQNFITDDTEALASAGEEATAGYIGEAIKRSRRFDSIRVQLPPDVARKLYLLSLAQTIPAPADAGKRRELANIETWMSSAYGKGQYCPPNGSPLLKYAHAETEAPLAGRQPDGHNRSQKPEPCLHLEQLSHVLATSRQFDELVEAWRGWHAVAAPMKGKYARYVELANAGARDIGFEDVGALWRAGYDMSPAEFEADVERLWADVKPLYDEVHCYVRGKLQAKYGKDKVPDRAPIPAQLLGNMWAQEWNNIYDMVVPYGREPSLDVSKKLESGHWDAQKMVRQGEHFFTALGFDPLPKTFWERSLFTRPRDREAVCHASAWDVTWSGASSRPRKTSSRSTTSSATTSTCSATTSFRSSSSRERTTASTRQSATPWRSA